MRRLLATLITALACAAVVSAVLPRRGVTRTQAANDFVHFESGHVHPLALTPDGTRLLAVNTADDQLAVFSVTGATPLLMAEIPVGLEPVSVAVRSNGEAWVVNQLSDDVSIVNLNTMHTRKTLRVGDEPNDVVFAGSPAQAYVSVSNEDVVKIYDPATLVLNATIPIAGRSPRMLARDASGSHVYVAIFHGNNRTSILPTALVPDDSIPQDPDFPRDSIPGHGAPKTGLIVQQQPPANNWFDRYGNMWNSKIKYTVQDVDVAEISTASQTVSRNFGTLGTANLAMAVNGTDGRIGVASLNARNMERFEERVRGYTVETNISFVTQTGNKAVTTAYGALLKGWATDLSSTL